jgi:hypothetical protein
MEEKKQKQINNIYLKNKKNKNQKKLTKKNDFLNKYFY